MLIADDEQNFLDLMRLQWENHYRDQLELHLLNPENEDVIAWVRDRLERRKPLDAIYVDHNLPTGKTGVEILKQLVGDVPAARYIPRVIMTADPAQEADEDTDALAAGAQRFMWKSKHHFLYEAALIVPQLRDGAQDQMWVDLNQMVARGIAARCEVRTLLDEVYDFLKHHFGINGWYIRKSDEDGGLRRLTREDPFGGGDILRPDDAPILANVLQSGEPLRTASLTEAAIGKRFSELLQGHRMIAVPLSFGGRVMGTVTLYRNPDQSQFRAKDEAFLKHLAIQVGAYLGELETQSEQRRRQSDLLEFVVSVDGLDNEDDIIKMLAKRLHKDIQRDNQMHAKTSVRKLYPSSGKIPRVAWLGMAESRPRDDLDIGNLKSVCAQSIREARVIRYADIARDSGGIYMATWIDARSELCVPIMTEDLALGCANMEHADLAFYSDDDQRYAEALCRFAGEAMIRVRGRKLLTQSLKLVARLVRPRGDLLDRAIELLYAFMGFRALLYLEPDREDSAWRVRRVYRDDGRPGDAADTERWQNTIDQVWPDSYIRCTLGVDQALFQTADVNKIARVPDVNLDTRSQAVLHLYADGDRSNPRGILSLEFRIPKPMSRFHQNILIDFGYFIGDLLRGGQVVEEYSKRLVTAERIAQMAAAYRQFRHTLITRLGSIGNALNNLEDVAPGHPGIERIRGTLKTLDQQVKAVRHLIKKPEPTDVLISQVWNDQIKELTEAADEAGIMLPPCEDQTRWHVDGEILSVIFFNLLLNATYYAGRGSTVSLTVEPPAERLRLFVRDTGVGIPSEVQDTLFCDGITTSSEGGGFGLHFSRIRARDLGGDLEYDPAWSAGAGFVLTLPRIDHERA